MSTSRDLLVQRVNELYHDALNADYSDTFRDIEVTERERWLKCAQNFMRAAAPLTIIEVGTGTGFVPLTVAPHLKAADSWQCSDISSGVLDLAREQLTAANLPCQFNFQKLTPGLPYQLPWPDAAADIVLMNSVLHHLENTPAFLAEISRIACPGGLIIIAHEPNVAFNRNKILRANFLLLDSFFNFRLKIAALGRRTGTLPLLRRIYYLLRPSRRSEMGRRGARMSDVFSRVNEQLMREGLIDAPMKESRIEALVDVHADEGFDPTALFPGFKIEMLETYNHILTVSSMHHGNRTVRRLDASLSRRWPNDGAIFFAAYRKP